MQFKAIAILAAVGSVVAQRPNGTSICDYYTTALLKDNTAANQMTLLTLVVNTAVIGNYTTPNVGIAVPGILAKGTFNGTNVNLAPYFNGGLKSTNGGGTSGEAVNFLDGGGAAPLMKNMPALDDKSRQYRLLTHLYEYFGVLLGCTKQGNTDFPAYNGLASQGSVHKFMNLNSAQIGYFITQVGLSALSFGVTQEDAAIVGKALGDTFGYRCAPPTVVVPSQGADLQAICQDNTCPIDPKGNQSVCATYGSADKPLVANATLAMGEGKNDTSPSGTTGSPSSTGSGAAATSKAAAAHIAGQAGAVLGVALLVFAL